MTATETTAVLPTTLLVTEATEAETRRVMARRAALSNTWHHRAERRDLLAECDVLLDRWLELTATPCA